MSSRGLQPTLGSQRRRRGGFTLIEVMLASVMAAMILLAVYAVFSRAMNMRDHATRRLRASQLRARASRTIRADLQNAWISGGPLASTLESSTTTSDGYDAAVPGFLRFTTTTGKDTAFELNGDVQQVEYYVARDDSAAGATPSGTLVRVLTRDLVDDALPLANDEQILTGVTAFTVSFYDGATWHQGWQYQGATAAPATTATATPTPAASTADTGDDPTTTLPVAIRIDIQQAAASPKDNPPPPLEITIPWTTQPFNTSS